MSSRWVRSVLQVKLGSSWEAVKQVYLHSRIPIYVRHFLADWMETQIADLSPHHFLIQLQQRCAEIPNCFFIDGSIDFAAALEFEFADNPQLLQSTLKECLHEEERIASQDELSWKNMAMEERAENDKIRQLRGRFEDIQDLLSKMNVLKAAGPEATSFFLLQQNELLTYKQAQAQLYVKIVGLLAELTILVRGYFKYTLDFWEYEKKKWFIGNKEMSSQVSLIEADAQRLQVFLRDLRRIVEQEDVWACGGSSLVSYVWELQGELMEMSIYIEDTPLIRKGSKFPLKIGFLSISGQELTPSDTNIRLEVKLLTSSQERGCTDRLSVCSSAMDDSLWREVGVVRGNMFPTTRRIGRRAVENEIRNHLFVCMEEFVLGTLHLPEGEYSQDYIAPLTDRLVYVCLSGWILLDTREFQFRKLSLPHVVTTHHFHIKHAWATILWNYGFSTFPEISSETPKSASWENILFVLGKYYSDKTKLTLTDSQLNYLTRRGNYSLNEQVDLKEFTKKTIFTFKPDAKSSVEKYSYWGWFYEATKMIEQMLKRHRKDGSEGEEWIQRMDKYFMGFISKNEAEEILKNAKKGIFLLRFSDSTPSGISVVINIDKGIPRSVMPFTKDDLPLSARIMKLIEAEYLYPGIQKSVVFTSSQEHFTGTKEQVKVQCLQIPIDLPF